MSMFLNRIQNANRILTCFHQRLFHSQMLRFSSNLSPKDQQGRFRSEKEFRALIMKEKLFATVEELKMMEKDYLEEKRKFPNTREELVEALRRWRQYEISKASSDPRQDFE